MIGRKDDDGKLWAGTVLAGFRPVLDVQALANVVYRDALGKITAEEHSDLVRALIAYFDTDLTVSARSAKAASILNRCPVALRGACEVGTYGARKYARDNWLYVNDGLARYYEAGGRHVLDMLCGDMIDEVARGGSGLPNLYHWCWNVFACASLVKPQPVAADFETNAISEGATNPPKVELRLPLEVGARYRRRNDEVVKVDLHDTSGSTFRVRSETVGESSGASLWVHADGSDCAVADTMHADNDPWDLVEGPLP